MWTRSKTACILLFATATMVAACTETPDKGLTASIDTLSRVQRDGVLNVGYVVYPPTVIKDPNSGELTGHFVDAIRFIADVMNVQLEFHEATFGTVVAGLQSGRFDLSIAATYRTIPRAMTVAFSRPIMYIGNGAIVRRGDERFESVDDMNASGLTLAVAQGEASHEYAREHLAQSTIHALETGDLAVPLTEVLAGRADVGLADSWTTAQFAEVHPDAVDLFAGHPYDLTPVGWAVRPDDVQWLQFVDTSLEYLQSTGRMDAWEAEYSAHWVKPVIEFRAD